MRKLILTLGAVALAIPSATVPISAASAQTRHTTYHYRGHTVHHSRCRYSKGTTGLVTGGVGGALVGHSVFGHGILGTVAGGVGGALAGRAIDRSVSARRRGCR